MARHGDRVYLDADDPICRILRDEELRDHAQAKGRGQRVRLIANIVTSALDGHALLRDPAQARIVINAALADALYGLVSVDIDPRP
jgi:hypothetical protein